MSEGDSRRRRRSLLQAVDHNVTVYYNIDGVKNAEDAASTLSQPRTLRNFKALLQQQGGVLRMHPCQGRGCTRICIGIRESSKALLQRHSKEAAGMCKASYF